MSNTTTTTTRFVPTRIVEVDGSWSTDWFVLDTEADDDPYIGPCRSKVDAEDTAARYNVAPVLAPTTPSVDYSGGFLAPKS